MGLFHRENTVAHNLVFRAGELKSINWPCTVHISCPLILAFYQSSFYNELI